MVSSRRRKVNTGRLRVNSFFPERIPEILNVEYFSLVPGKSCLLQEHERSTREVGKFIWLMHILSENFKKHFSVNIIAGLPTCPTWAHFIQDKLKISIYLSLDKCKICYKVNKILYIIFWLINLRSHVALKTVWILISWLLQKPADLDLHCLQES